MEFGDVLRRRHMVRSYREDPIPPEVLERIVRVVRRAPSAGFSQGYRLVVVTDDGTRKAIADLLEPPYLELGWEPWISRAPAHVVLTVDEAAYHRRYREPDKVRTDGTEMDWPVPYWYVDGGALLMLLQLTAIDEGLASGFCCVPDDMAVKELLGLPHDVALLGVITLGYPTDDSAVPIARLRERRRAFGELVRWERWS